MSTLAKINHAFAAGAAAGLLQGILLALVSGLGLFLLLGLGLQLDITRFWFYQHVTWGGLWGLGLAAPVLPRWRGWLRGALLGLLPSLATLVYFLPFQNGLGIAGLALGPLMPVVVILFNVLWGVLAGLWWEMAVGPPAPEGHSPED